MKNKLTLLVITPNIRAAQERLKQRHSDVFDLREIYNIRYVVCENDILGHTNESSRVYYIPGWFKVREAHEIRTYIRLRQIKSINS